MTALVERFVPVGVLVLASASVLWLLFRPHATLQNAPLTPRQRRAWLILGALVGATLLLVNLGTNYFVTTVGGAQGLVLASNAASPRRQRVVLMVACLLVIAAVSLNLAGVPAFATRPTGTV